MADGQEYIEIVVSPSNVPIAFKGQYHYRSGSTKQELKEEHKLYSGPAILLRVFDKSVELWNYGLLPEELTPADLMKKHASYPRNRNIATVFYKAGFIESWGRGYKKIREEFEKARHPVPTGEESGGGVLVTIQRKTIEEIIASREESGAVNFEMKYRAPSHHRPDKRT